MVVGVGDKDIPRSIDGDSARMVEKGSGGGRAVRRETIKAIAHHGRDGAVLSNAANPGVVVIGNEYVAGRIHEHIGGSVEHRSAGWAAVARKSGGAAAGDGRDDSGRGDLSND